VRIAVALPLAVLLLGASAAHAGSGDAGAIGVSHAWIRILPAGLPAGGYAILMNDGDSPIVLVGARSADFGEIMLHRSVTVAGTSRMLAVQGLAIPAHGSVALAPGGYHLMLMRARRAVTPGQHVAVTLLFTDGRSRTATFLARPANALSDR
jgi:periplasmic copper chaperone A